jgi:hypothetical protein
MSDEPKRVHENGKSWTLAVLVAFAVSAAYLGAHYATAHKPPLLSESAKVLCQTVKRAGMIHGTSGPIGGGHGIRCRGDGARP